MRAIRLQTEYLKNPVGIDMEHPRLFWNCEGGMRQSACRILAFNEQGEELWDTGKVESSRMTHIPYRGKALKSRDRVSWKVKLWDENDVEGDWSEEAVFEMGLLEPADWRASWITGDYVPDKKKRYPVDLFKKKFSLDASAKVRKARLYVTACGDYEARINGQRAGDFVLAPGITDYTVRLQYQTYDVTELLRTGENELFFSLADGWYRGSVGAWGLTCQYGVETKLLAQLEITLEDGSVQMIGTDSSFLWSNEGPIRFADHKDGEIVDARREADASWGGVRVTACDVVPTASDNVWIREKEHFSPKVIITPGGKTVLDFGQNIAGYIAFTVTAKEGQEVFLRFGEMLDENGEFTQKNIQCSNKKKTSPLQQVRYTCKEGENHYKTSFAIFGFQLVQIETDVDWKPEDFTAIAVYSDMEQRTFFDSSNELLNRLVESTLWSARNNSADIPTDCPTRERHGWTGDAQIFFNTAAYLLDYAAFARKFEQDLCDWQAKDKKGRFPQIAPAGGVDSYMETMNGSVGWSDAGVMIPYRFWEIYGDRKILADNYAAMKKYARFMIRRCGKRGLFAKSLHLSGEAKKIRGQHRAVLRGVGGAGGRASEQVDRYDRAPSGSVHRLHRVCDAADEGDRPGAGQGEGREDLRLLRGEGAPGLSGAGADAGVRSGYGPAGIPGAPSVLRASGRGAGAVREEAPAGGAGSLRLAAGNGISVHAADSGCAGGDRYRGGLPSAGK